MQASGIGGSVWMQADPGKVPRNDQAARVRLAANSGKADLALVGAARAQVRTVPGRGASCVDCGRRGRGFDSAMLKVPRGLGEVTEILSRNRTQRAISADLPLEVLDRRKNPRRSQTPVTLARRVGLDAGRLGQVEELQLADPQIGREALSWCAGRCPRRYGGLPRVPARAQCRPWAQRAGAGGVTGRRESGRCPQIHAPSDRTSRVPS
jgi:hypothetical protein